MKAISLNTIDVPEAIRQLNEATTAKKCWACGCFHNSLTAIGKAVSSELRSTELEAAISAAKERLLPVKYDCLGCSVCYPPLAMNALNIEDEACPTEQVEARAGWPPLPGAYTILRFQAPVAVCTLNDEQLSQSLAATGAAELALVGTCHTENLGIERVIQNVLANPHIRFLIVCGADSRQVVGHLPGQSLVALAASGVESGMRIIGANGKRPLLRNIGPDAVEHFRKTVEVIDSIGETGREAIARIIRKCAARNPGAATPFAPQRLVWPERGYVPERTVSDPAGYFVIYVDHIRGVLSLEHYSNHGVLNGIVEGTTAAEVYTPAIEHAFVSRLDHAAYLGRELARAEEALRSREPYVQDGAPERESLRTTGQCGCKSACQAEKAQ